jgi:HEAT repeat protein
MDTSFAFALCALGLLVGLVLLVLCKRVVRARAERSSNSRRVGWITALGTGPVSDMRMRELRKLARRAARGRAQQEDLLSLLSAGRLPPRDERREPFERALRRAGLHRSLRRACRSRQPVTRGRAALVWAGLGLGGAERRIAPLTRDPDRDVRAAAVQALGGCRSEEAAWALLAALRDGHVEPQRVVERLTGEWAVSPLLMALHLPEYAGARDWLAEALGLTGDARAERPLIRLLADGDQSQRIRACRALGRLGLESSGGVLVKALSDDSPAVRAQAARALAELRDPHSVYALVQLLGDSAWWVRARAAEALGALGAQGIAALRWCAETHPDPYARERAAEALSHSERAESEPAADEAAAARAA